MSAAARDLLAELAPLELNSKLAVGAVLVAKAVRVLAGLCAVSI